MLSRVKNQGFNGKVRHSVCGCFFCFCGDIFLKHVLKIIVCFFSKGAAVFNFNCLLVLEFEHPRYLKNVGSYIYIYSILGIPSQLISGWYVVGCSRIQKRNQPLQLMLDSINLVSTNGLARFLWLVRLVLSGILRLKPDGWVIYDLHSKSSLAI